MEAKPLRSLPLSDSGKWCGPQKTHEKSGTVTIEANQSIKRETSSINLGLRIGGNTAQNSVSNEHGKPVFTPAQRQEFQLQALIFKYLSAQLPVPLHLVLPIWKSVVNALGSANIYKEYPSFIRFSPQGFDYRNMMDPEPGRCRRTDGKKWRCRKQVLSDQKYCERHLHRGLGRPRSRKPVEASEIASPPAIKSNNDSENSNANLPVSTPIIPVIIPSSSNTSTSNNTTTPAATTSTYSYTKSNKNLSGNKDTTAITPSTTNTSNPAIGMISNDNRSINNHNVDRKDDGDNHGGNINIINSSINNLRNNVSPVMGFSPKSVLQVLGCSSPCFDHSSSTDPEPGRCRRTDGKKWRCSKDVVPNQKYCVQHMHRGAKKRAVASQPEPVPIHATATGTNHITTMTVPKKADCAILNMSLSLSIPAGRQLTTNDEKITTSSDSDTTITDTTITAYETSNISS